MRCSPAVSRYPSERDFRPRSSCTLARALHAPHQSSQRSSDFVTSSKSASSTPFETKRGAQWEMAEVTRGSFAKLDFFQCLEDSFRSKRHARYARIEGRERVVDRVHHRRGRAGGAGLAHALGAELRLQR